MKVAVYCWAGHQNFGDELILEGMKKLFKGWQVVVMSNEEPVKGSYPLIDFGKVNECDLFVLGGGELIQRSWLFSKISNCRFYPFKKQSWIHQIKIPKMILGCGVNAESACELSKYTVGGLEQFGYIGLRDNVAVNILQSFPQLTRKVHLFYDLAFALDTPKFCWRPKNNTAVVVPTDRFNFGDYGVRETEISVKSEKWLNSRLQSYDKTVFLAFGKQDNDDYETCKELSRGVSNVEVLRCEKLSLPKVLDIISKASMVFPYRLHGLILSYIVGAPYEFYPYHWKLKRVHDTISGLNIDFIQKKQKECFEEAKEMVGFD